MHLFGTTHDQLGAIAVGQREWALMNPQAQMRKPMTLEDYHASRWIVEPLHLFDCCLVSNGGVAVIVTSAERARELRQPPVYMRGFGQCAPGDTGRVEREPAIHTGAAKAGEIALRQAGIELSDVDVLELYDCYTYTVLVTLEDYGFCEKGEGGAFVADGKLAPGGSLPVQHRRRSALLLLHVGLHAAGRRRDPGSRPGRRAAGRQARPRTRLRQRRRAELPLDDDPQQARRIGITMTTTAAPPKPVPVPDEISAPFFEGALAGQLMLLRCRACGTFMLADRVHRRAAAGALRELLLG